jgi:hypothetical protein
MLLCGLGFGVVFGAVAQPVADFHIGLNAAVFIALLQETDQLLGLAAQPGQFLGGEPVPFVQCLIFNGRPFILQDVFSRIQVNDSSLFAQRVFRPKRFWR